MIERGPLRDRLPRGVEDGVLLCITLIAAVLLLAVAAMAAWETLSAAGWVSSFL